MLVDRTLTFRELVCALVALQYGPAQQGDALAELPWGMRAAAHHDFDWRWRVLVMVQDESLPEPYYAVTRRFGEVGVRLVTQHEGGVLTLNQDQWSYRTTEAQGNLRGDLASRMEGVRALLKTAHEPLLLTAAPEVSAEEVLNAALAFDRQLVRILPSTSLASR